MEPTQTFSPRARACREGGETAPRLLQSPLDKERGLRPFLLTP
jgi:hypothetical protein